MHRIIPAHAGQTQYVKLLIHMRLDHPRTCGANAARGAGVDFEDGSSPHMRGKQEELDAKADEIRIIPAHAGQTPWV